MPSASCFRPHHEVASSRQSQSSMRLLVLSCVLVTASANELRPVVFKLLPSCDQCTLTNSTNPRAPKESHHSPLDPFSITTGRCLLTSQASTSVLSSTTPSSCHRRSHSKTKHPYRVAKALNMSASCCSSSESMWCLRISKPSTVYIF